MCFRFSSGSPLTIRIQIGLTYPFFLIAAKKSSLEIIFFKFTIWVSDVVPIKYSGLTNMGVLETSMGYAAKYVCMPINVWYTTFCLYVHTLYLNYNI
jgi:hypothetical protein